VKLRLVEPRQGIAWVKSAFRVFGRQPIGFAAVFATCLFILMLLSLIPIVGTAALLVLPPAGSLVFMIASRIAAGGNGGADVSAKADAKDAGKGPMPGAFTELAGAGRRTWLELIKMGLLYAGLTFLGFWLASVLDGGAFEAALEQMSRERATPEQTAERFTDPRVQLGLFLRLAIAAIVSLPYWHAPALVHWGGLGWSKSLFFSTVAVWRNKGAFLVYGLVWAGIFLGAVGAVALAVGITGVPQLALIATPLTLALTTVFYASLWFTFQDSFSNTTEEIAP
jgi:hypothetical protein